GEGGGGLWRNCAAVQPHRVRQCVLQSEYRGEPEGGRSEPVRRRQGCRCTLLYRRPGLHHRRNAAPCWTEVRVASRVLRDVFRSKHRYGKKGDVPAIKVASSQS